VRVADGYSDSYLVGLYLGDGYIASTARGFQLVITLDADYPWSVAILDQFVGPKR
jgi:hypothetical protein